MHNSRTEAIRRLADGYHAKRGFQYEHNPIPCLIAVYQPETWTFRVHPLNDRARQHYNGCVGQTLTEQRFVRSLHLLRKSVLTAEDESAIAQLNNSSPENS